MYGSKPAVTILQSQQTAGQNQLLHQDGRVIRSCILMAYTVECHTIISIDSQLTPLTSQSKLGQHYIETSSTSSWTLNQQYVDGWQSVDQLIHIDQHLIACL